MNNGGHYISSMPLSSAYLPSNVSHLNRHSCYYVIIGIVIKQTHPMLLDNYYSQNQNHIHFSRQQGSDFAKKIAGDFNPIHDVDNKRFCVPGDLLFAVVLSKHGVSQEMHLTFSGMVPGDVPLNFTASDADKLVIIDDNDKEYLSIDRRGAISTDDQLIEDLTLSYVEFSGQTFPHILVPLMRDNNVMINPDRPMVIYESMAIKLSRLNIQQPKLELSKSSLEVNGKRGNVRLEFSLTAAGEVVGSGEKNMVLSGLRDFDEAKMQQLDADYSARKQAYVG